MIEIETLYPSYQELLLDLDIFGRMMTNQDLDDKEEYKNLLFEEYSKSHPLPSLESKDYELGDVVSAEFHVSYLEELELSQNESVMDFDDDDEEDASDCAFEKDIISKEELESLPKGVFNKPVSIAERDSVVNEMFSQYEAEVFTGDIEKVESAFGTVETDTEGYEEEVVEDTSEDDDEEFNYDDDEGSEDDEAEEYDYDDDSGGEDEETTSDNGIAEEEFEPEIDIIPVQVPKPVIPVVIEEPPKPKEQVSVPSDVLQYLREHPHSEISEVLKYYPRKELERYIRIGKVIKKGSKVYL